MTFQWVKMTKDIGIDFSGVDKAKREKIRELLSFNEFLAAGKIYLLADVAVTRINAKFNNPDAAVPIDTMDKADMGV